MRNKTAYNSFSFFIILFISAYLLPGCSVKKYNLIAPYLDSVNTVQIKKYPFEYSEPTIQPYEFVEVRFAGLNANVSSTLNNYGGTSLETQLTGKEGSFSGQQVDKEGDLNFPLIGKVRAAGLTTDLLRVELLKKVEPLLKEPFVYVGLPKRGVTLMGEVKLPATFVFTKERANILEFLAQAGSVTEFADITKVKVYRETSNGQRLLGNVNLNDSSLFNSPFFYPTPNDVVYVPASKKRSFQSGTTFLPYITLLFSLLSLAITFIIRK